MDKQDIVDNQAVIERFEILDPEEFKKMGKQQAIAVEVETKVSFDEGAIEAFKQICLMRKTKRGTSVFVHSFEQVGENLKFTVEEEVGQSFNTIFGNNPLVHLHHDSPVIANTFVDFCWTLSEGTTNHTIGEVQTKVRPNAEMGDLTWVLPSKFCDDLIEVMHALNLSIIDGMLEHAIIYGPIF